MRKDRERQQALRIAMAFNRPDVDQFLSEIEHEQYAEWCAFLTTEPVGWRALSLQTQRLGYLIAQSASRKKLNERDYAHSLQVADHDPALERARLEAMSIRMERSARKRR